jgi:hypothetical protein
MTSDPHAVKRAELRAEAAELRRLADELWARDKKERAAYEHAQASKLIALANEPDLPAALERRRHDSELTMQVIQSLMKGRR